MNRQRKKQKIDFTKVKKCRSCLSIHHFLSYLFFSYFSSSSSSPSSTGGASHQTVKDGFLPTMDTSVRIEHRYEDAAAGTKEVLYLHNSERRKVRTLI